MKLSEEETEAVLYCVTELVDRRARAGVPVPQWMHGLAQRFNLASLMSPWGHQFDCGGEESKLPLEIGTPEAADILGMSARHVRRLANDLDGEMIGGRLISNRAIVEKYAKEGRNGQPR